MLRINTLSTNFNKQPENQYISSVIVNIWLEI